MANTAFENWEASMPSGVGASFVKSCDSTNILAREAAKAGEAGPRWFIAGQQNAGRGRQGRQWLSEEGNLYASLMFRPKLTPADMAGLPFVVSLAIRDTLIGLGAEKDAVFCKWPNDVLIGDKKASGVLIESSATNGQALDYVIIGIGINLAHYPDGTPFPATSLEQETSIKVSVKNAVALLASHMFRRLTEWNPTDFAPLKTEWENCAWGLGKHCTLRTAAKSFSGIPKGLDDSGALVVVLDDGTTEYLYAGDVFPVENAGPVEE